MKSKNIRKVIVLIFLAFSLFMIMSSANAADITLNPSDANNFKSIVESRNSGDIVTLTAGGNDFSLINNNMHVEINKTITIRSSSSSQNAVISLRSTMGLFNVTNGGHLILNRITIKNAATNVYDIIDGGGIYNNQGGAVTLTDCIFENNSVRGNGAAIENYGSITLTRCVFKENNNSQHGGSPIDNYGSITLIDCSFIDNIASHAGAIFNREGGSVNLDHCNFVKNRAISGSGGAITNLGTIILSNCNFTENNADSFGGAINNYGDYATLNINNCNFSYNDAYDSGGAICIRGGSFNISGCNFIENLATVGSGGAIYNNGYESIKTINNCTFIGNFEDNGDSYGGGAIYNDGNDNLSINNCTFNNNRVISNGGAIYNVGILTINNSNFNNSYADYGNGGAIYNPGTLTIYNSNFNNNLADEGYGGAIYNYGYYAILNLNNCNFYNNSASEGGGAIYNYGEYVTLNLNNCNFYNNSAAVGGAIYNYGVYAILNLNNCNFYNNSAINGGAIYNNLGTVNSVHCNFINNSALLTFRGQGGAIYNINNFAVLNLNNSNFTNNSAYEGGAIYNNGTNILSTINNCTFNNNTANMGGAIYSSYNIVTLTFNNCIFMNNRATNGLGGGIYNNGTINFTRCDFINNSATGNDGGGGIYNNANANLTFNDCTFTNNTVNNAWGGAILNEGGRVTLTGCNFINNKATGSISTGSGGAIFNDYGGSVTLTRCNFFNNSANSGGGAIFNNWGSANTTLINCTFTNNTADGGGAIANWGKVNLTGSTFTNNNALYGGAVINDEQATLISNNCAFINNTAGSGEGGAIYSNYGTILNVSSSVFLKNYNTDYEIYLDNNGNYNLRDNFYFWVLDQDNQNINSFIYNTINNPLFIGSYYYMNISYSFGLGQNLTLNYSISHSSGANLNNLTVTNITLRKNNDPITFNFRTPSQNNIQIPINIYVDLLGFYYNNELFYVIKTEQEFSSTININNSSLGGIRQALDLVEDGGTINLNPGTYSGNNNTNITINRNVVIQGNGSVNNVTIDADLVNIIFTINEGLNVVFINITFTRGYAIFINGGSVTLIGCNFINNPYGAIYNDQGGITATNCNFINNTGTEGGAILSDDGSIDLKDCNFTNNKATSDGGGAIYNYGRVILTGCIFTNNSATVGYGGAFYTLYGYVNLTDCNFINNTASLSGGAIEDESGYPFTIKNCNFTNNSANEGGAIFTYRGNIILNDCNFNNSHANYMGGVISNDRGSVNFTGCNFTNNYAYNSVGVISNNGGSVNFTGCTFTNNFAGYSAGVIYNNGTLVAINCSFINNTAYGDYAGVIWNLQGNVNFTGCNFTNNSVGSDGGAIFNEWGTINLLGCIFINNSGNGGGAIFSEGVGSNLTIDNCNFTNNSGMVGGAIINDGNATITSCNFTGNSVFDEDGWGGAIFNRGSVNFTGCNFINNSAHWGGAIYNGGNVNLSICDFTSNNASYYGGAINNAGGNLTINICIFASNFAYDDGTGGAISNNGNNARVTINNSNFTNNIANFDNGGGAIYNNEGNITADNCIFKNNTCAEGGAISNSGILNLDNCNFINNSANCGAAITNMGSANLTRCNFINNSASWIGGAICSGVTTSILLVYNCNFTNNFVTSEDIQYYGGAIYINRGNVNLTGCNFINNSAIDGGAIYNQEGNVSLTSCNFTNNKATNRGGAIYNNDIGSVFNIIANSCVFSGNFAFEGKDIYGNNINLINCIFDTISSDNFKSMIDNANQDSVIILTSGMEYSLNFQNVNIIINKNITIKSSDSSENAIINLNGHNRAFVIVSGGYLTLIGITIINGNTTGGFGGAIYNNGGSFNLTGCNFINNIALLGGAIANVGIGTITNCTFSNNSINSSSGRGGAINNAGSSTLTLFGCSFSNNSVNSSSGQGGAIANVGSSTLTLFGCSFSNNSVNSTLGRGGAIYNEVSILNVSSSVFYNNSGDKTIYISGGSCNLSDNFYFWVIDYNNQNLAPFIANTINNPSLIGSFYYMNISYSSTIYAGQNLTLNYDLLYNGSVNLDNFTATNITLRDNNVPLAFNVKYTPRTIVIPSNNVSDLIGFYYNDEMFYKINVEQVTPTIININNTTEGGIRQALTYIANGGTITLNPGTYSGYNNTNITVNKNVTIQGNGSANSVIIDAELRNMIFTINSGMAVTFINITFTRGNSSFGGAIYNYGSRVNLNGSIFINNKANNIGGAIFNGPGSTLIANNCSFNNNSATSNGGAIYNEGGNATLNNCNFTNNSAINEGVIYNNGVNANLTANNCSFVNNSAEIGGAFWNDAEASLNNCSFVNNSADYGGGIFNQGNLFVSGNTMTGNTASILGDVIYNNGTMGKLNLIYLNNSTVDAENNTLIDLFASLTDDMGNPITGGNISFYVDGVFKSSVMSIEGVANINYTPITTGILVVNGTYNSSGRYSITILEGAINSSSSIKLVTNSTIGAANTLAGQNVTISGLANFNGVILANTTLNLTINGTTVTVNTNGVGAWSYVYTPPVVGTYSIVISMVANTTHDGFSNASSFDAYNKWVTNSTIEVEKNVLGGEVTISGRAYYNGGILVYTTLNLTINGTTSPVNTDAYGNWYYYYTPPFIGTYNIEISMVGNSTHEGFSNSSNFNLISYYRVDPDGFDGGAGDDNDPFQTLEYAIYRAYSDGIDVIILNGGNYTVALNSIIYLNIDYKDLSIYGAKYFDSNEEDTILDAEDYGRFFNIADGVTLNIYNIIFKNGYEQNGGAISSNGGVLLLDTVEFIDCVGFDYGAVIYAENNFDDWIFTDVTFKNNIVHGNGGAIYYSGDSNLVLNNCVFINNSATNLLWSNYLSNGGAIYYSGDSDLVLNNCVFINNSATNLYNSYLSNGGAIYYSGDSNLIVNNCNFTNNLAYNDGGAIYCEAASVTLTDSNFTNNSAGYGGAIFNNGSLTINNCNFTNNTAINYSDYPYSDKDGGAIYNNGNLSANNCVFTNNSAERYGGAICFEEGNVILTDCNFTNNMAANYGGGGGAIFSHWEANLTIISSNFTDNSAEIAGAIYNTGAANLTSCNFINNSAYHDYGCSGGAISNCFGDMNLTACYFKDNSAYDGGAISNEGWENLIINCTDFYNNSATNGGAILNYGVVNLTSCNFINNSAIYGGAIYNTFYGGPANLTVNGNNFTNNSANYGGAIFNRGDMIVSNNTMVGNTASILGDVIYNNGTMSNLNLTYLDNSSLEVINSTSVILYANLTDDMGNLITGGNVSFFVNGVNQGNAVFNEGLASITYTPNNIGTVVVNGSYMGSGTHSIIILEGELVIKIFTTNSTISADNVVVGSSVTISGVADYNGVILAYATLNLSINGISVTVNTDGSGAWSYSFAPPVGNYTIIISMVGNGTHEGFSNSSSFVVSSKLLTNSSIVADNVVLGQNVIIRGVANYNGVILANTVLNLTINGNTVSVTTDGVGAWDYDYTPLTANTYTIVISMMANSTHEGFTNSSSFSIINYYTVAINGSDVNGTGSISNPFNTLENAISKAKSNGIDTIRLSEGTYNGAEHGILNLNIDFNLKIYGAKFFDPNSKDTIFNANGLGRFFIIKEGATLDIQNIKFMYGHSSENGGGILSGGGTCILINVEFIACTSEGDGAAIYAVNNSDDWIITDVIFENNMARGNNDSGIFTFAMFSNFEDEDDSGNGGAIFADYADNWAFKNVYFINNLAAKDGGAIFAKHANRWTFDYGTFEGSTADGDGGAIFVSDSEDLSFVGTEFIDNSASGNGGSIATNGVNDLKFEDVTFEGSAADGDGGALSVVNSDGLSFVGTEFVDNSASGNGGSIATEGSTDLKFEDVTFEGSIADGDGGALSVVNSDGLSFVGTEFVDNSASGNGGSIASEGSNDLKFEDVTFDASSSGGDGGVIFAVNSEGWDFKDTDFGTCINGEGNDIPLGVDNSETWNLDNIKYATKIVVNNINVVHGQSVILTAHLTGNGQDLKEEKIEFYVNGSFVGDAETNDEGIAVFDYTNLAPIGTFTWYACFAEKGEFKDSQAFGTLTVLSYANLESSINSINSLNSNLYTTASWAALEVPLNNAKAMNVTRNASSQDQINNLVDLLNVAKGKLVLVGSSTNGSSNGSTPNTVVNKAASNLVITTIKPLFNKANTIKVTARDSSGKLLANKVVALYINNKFYKTAVTNAAGVASFSYTFKTRSVHKIVAQFTGDTTHLLSNSNALSLTPKDKTTLNLAKVKAKFKQKATFKATLKNSKNKPMAKKVVKFYANKKLLGQVKTDAKGVATLTKVVPIKGTVSFIARYAGDKNNHNSDFTRKIKVK